MYTYDYEYTVYRKEPEKPSIIKRWGASLVASIVKCARDFCNDTSIHGFNHIAAARRHWLERLLWIAACVLAIWGALDVSLGQLQRYNESPTVVTLEKDFRSWQFNLPAVTCCYVNRLDKTKLPAVIKKYWGVDIHDEQYAYYTRFVNAVVNSDLFHLKKFEEFKDMDTQVDMFQIAVDVMPPAIIKTMSSCGELKWWPVMTEAGACYVINSVALYDVAIVKPKVNETPDVPYTCKYSLLSCYILADVTAAANYYVHSPYDVMDLAAAASHVFTGLTRVTELSIMETRCGRGVKNLQPKRRGCLYTDEPTTVGRRVYSTNTCRLSCRSRLAMKLCGCIPFYYFYEDRSIKIIQNDLEDLADILVCGTDGPICTPAGMWCLSHHAHEIASNHKQKCTCAPQCTDSVFKEIINRDQIWDRVPFTYRGSVRYIMQAPRTRYTREIVFHFQDLVVSFGGAAGLFLGASFISFIEILYFLMAGLFRTIVKKKDLKGSLQTTAPVKVKVPTVPHVKARIEVLTAVLESQKEYNYNNMRLYH